VALPSVSWNRRSFVAPEPAWDPGAVTLGGRSQRGPGPLVRGGCQSVPRRVSWQRAGFWEPTDITRRTGPEKIAAACDSRIGIK